MCTMACMHGVHTIHMQGIHGASMSDVTKHAQDNYVDNNRKCMYRRSRSYSLSLINCTSLCLAILEARRSLSLPFSSIAQSCLPLFNTLGSKMFPPTISLTAQSCLLCLAFWVATSCTIRKNSLLHETTASLLLSESIT